MWSAINIIAAATSYYQMAFCKIIVANADDRYPRYPIEFADDVKNYQINVK